MRLADLDLLTEWTTRSGAARRPDRCAGAGTGRLLLVLAAVAVVLWPAAPALAHNSLVSATPDRNAVLREAPTEVALAFLQRLDAGSTTIAVTDAGKQPVAASAPTVKAKTAKLAFDQPLGNGEYTVEFSVVSVDGHPVKGKYTFTVADPSAVAQSSAAAPGPAVAPSAAASAPVATVAVAAESGSGSDSGSGVPAGALIGVGGLAVALAAVAAYLYAVRRRRA